MFHGVHRPEGTQSRVTQNRQKLERSRDSHPLERLFLGLPHSPCSPTALELVLLQYTQREHREDNTWVSYCEIDMMSARSTRVKNDVIEHNFTHFVIEGWWWSLLACLLSTVFSSEFSGRRGSDT